MRKMIELLVNDDKKMTIFLDQIAAVVQGNNCTYIWQCGTEDALVTTEAYDEVMAQIKEAEMTDGCPPGCHPGCPPDSE